MLFLPFAAWCKMVAKWLQKGCKRVAKELQKSCKKLAAAKKLLSKVALRFSISPKIFYQSAPNGPSLGALCSHKF
jgi:hypothetical protein